MNQTCKFEIQLEGAGGSILVNDQDLTDQVQGLSLQTEANGLPTLTLFLHAGGKISGEGIVEVVPLTNISEAIGLFMSQLDWGKILQDFMNDNDFSNPLNPGEILQQKVVKAIDAIRPP